ncbi:MAG: 3-oxoacyl-ACP reductase FabG [Gammaproteobacteria bacterium]|nr:3-oxoacyl-ACP reductase FabG [Gammaproteobacteria bacterium]NND38744.1 3-oxoacyl-ACP reductase FabG [Pseudomonadales bacterium]NNL11136.1 3-oxoacyl-ACP reductase FabG [Pseudomonadales bacterium]NNM12208.1 3-oxoacyl-ACP reductase FabG [Pseudomonadales bacterium]RZV54300.1 MAG: 3-oxoacyl-ACP reductase FabG [Pseudomonadales bacterium]
MNEDIQARVALVTGASRGIGKAIALALGRDGFIIAGTATSQAGADAISTYLDEAGITGSGFALNVTDAEQVQTVVKEIGERFSAPQVVVNNAGITRDNLMLRMKPEEWDAVVDTNLNAAYRVVKACLKGMTRARWGRIINISSVVGSMGNAGQANYAATKAGIAGFGRALARELGSRAITVNTVAPGLIETDMTDALPEDQKKALAEQIPLARLGQASEIADVVAFLASDRAAYISGETLHVNGGMYMG